jgi:membrane protease subunit (stomatin/prohibitin family)
MISVKMIAPCGMNCGICIGHIRDKNQCPGCRMMSAVKPEYCLHCVIYNCEHFKNSKSKFCFDCKKYPCKRLKQLDKRYRNKYGMSMLHNLENIRRNGIRSFVKSEKSRWACPECGSTLSVHRINCLNCGKPRTIELFPDNLN